MPTLATLVRRAVAPRAAPARAAAAALRAPFAARGVPTLCRATHTGGGVEASTPAEAVQAVEEEESSTPSHVVVNFYHLVDVAHPRTLRKDHERFLKGRDVRGRIYVSPQGVNAQFSATAADARAYALWLSSLAGFEGVTPNIEPCDGHLFPKLRLKFKPCLVSLAGGHGALPVTDPAARAAPLSPSEWEAMLLDSPPDNRPIVLDVRNAYEWDAGHFAGAARPLEDAFRETPTRAASEATGDGGDPPPPLPAALVDAPKDAPVMMYCTGGIRCDIYSAHLKREGFTNLHTLHGGVHRYFRERGGAGWKGALFVFDARLAVAPGGGVAADASTTPAAPCARCGGVATLPHLNCANIDCNALFLACDGCKAGGRGCCRDACVDAPRLLRPAKVAGHYGTWATEAVAAGGEGADALARMAAGRGEGRLTRRRSRASRHAERRADDRADRAERKEAARAALKARAGGEGEGGGGGDATAASRARLAELRARLAAR